jgi:hypothetical protein
MQTKLRVQGARINGPEGYKSLTAAGKTRRLPLAGISYQHESGFKVFVPESHSMGQRHYHGVHAASYQIGSVSVILRQHNGRNELIGDLPASWLVDISGECSDDD